MLRLFHKRAHSLSGTPNRCFVVGVARKQPLTMVGGSDDALMDRQCHITLTQHMQSPTNHALIQRAVSPAILE
jgi:hypothetical protein